jgi:uncharacterized protein
MPMLKQARIVSVLSLFPLPQYVVVLEDIDKTKLVPIWIGVNEGNAIALEMQGEKFPRPLTHDLMVLMLKALGAEIEKVVVSDLKDNSYYALIYIKYQGKTISMDARPSDSLALAVRVHCPIFIDEKVLEKCPELQGPITHEEVEKFKSALKTMSPEEFFKKLEEAPPAPAPEIGESFEDPPLGEQGEEDDEDEDEGDGEDKPGEK